MSYHSLEPQCLSLSLTDSPTLHFRKPCPDGCHRFPPAEKTIPWYGHASAILCCLLPVGIPARRRRSWATLGMFFLFLALVAGVTSCGGGTNGGGGGGCTAKTDPGTTPGSYTVTVTGTSGTTTAITAINLTVQ